MFKCYNQDPGAPTNPENVKNNNPVIYFGKPFSASLWKNEPLRFRTPCDVERALNLQVSTYGTTIVFSQATSVYQF